MSSQKKKTPAEELLDSILNEVGDSNESGGGASGGEFHLDSDEPIGELNETVAVPKPTELEEHSEIAGIVNLDPTVVGNMDFGGLLRDKKSKGSQDKTEVKPQATGPLIDPQSSPSIQASEFSSEEGSPYEATRIASIQSKNTDSQFTQFGELELEPLEANVVDLNALKVADQKKKTPLPAAEEPKKSASLFAEREPQTAPEVISDFGEDHKTEVILQPPMPTANFSAEIEGSQIATVAVAIEGLPSTFPKNTELNNSNNLLIKNTFDEPKSQDVRSSPTDSERTLAVTGFQIKHEESLEDKVKVSVGKPSRSSGYSSWGGGVDGNLSQADNLRMAQEKILELENENERLRRQNEELISASEILKERSDLMMAQLTEYKNDRDGLEQSFKNEMTLLKNHLVRKDAELKKAQFKVEELESRLKFDLKKIRVRERELENRLELVRAEKNAISKNKDEQILDLRRKMDVIQMEVDSYRQKCVELNKQIESSQDSFKRTTRALRLAMANLELQEENKDKAQLKKAE